MKESDLGSRFRAYIDSEGLLDGVKAVVVGVSGGADSICLLNLMSDISRERGITLVPAHVHHGIRGDEADRDAAFSCAAAEKLGWNPVICRIDVPAYATEHGLSTEEAARILRYRELERICEEKNADVIALAHHRGDQAETILMNLFRGTGPAGLSGMAPRFLNRIRPLLFASKGEILEYLQDKNITFVEDSTNSDPDYTRNRIRTELLPLVESMFPQAEAHITAAGEDIREWQRYIRTELEQHRSSPAFIDRAAYLALPPALQTEWLRVTLEAVITGAKDVSRKHYGALDDLLRQNTPGRRIDLPGDCYAESTYEGLRLAGSRSQSDPDSTPGGEDECAPITKSSSIQTTGTVSEQEIPVPGTLEPLKNDGFSGFTTELIDRNTFYKKKNEIFNEKDYTKYLDYDKIENGLWLRHPRGGDYLVIDGNGSRKKLNRFYIDRKIPRESRARQEVIADGSCIVWALPDRISESYKVTDETRQILKITREPI